MKSISIDIDTMGDNTLVAADATRRVRVLAYKLVAASSVTTQFFDGPSSGNLELTGPMSQIVGVPNDGNPCPHGDMQREYHFQTSVDSPLVLKLGAGVQVSGSLLYDLVIGG